MGIIPKSIPIDLIIKIAIQYDLEADKLAFILNQISYAFINCVDHFRDRNGNPSISSRLFKVQGLGNYKKYLNALESSNIITIDSSYRTGGYSKHIAFRNSPNGFYNSPIPKLFESSDDHCFKKILLEQYQDMEWNRDTWYAEQVNMNCPYYRCDKYGRHYHPAVHGGCKVKVDGETIRGNDDLFDLKMCGRNLHEIDLSCAAPLFLSNRFKNEPAIDKHERLLLIQLTGEGNLYDHIANKLGTTRNEAKLSFNTVLNVKPHGYSPHIENIKNMSSMFPTFFNHIRRLKSTYKSKGYIHQISTSYEKQVFRDRVLGKVSGVDKHDAFLTIEPDKAKECIEESLYTIGIMHFYLKERELV